VLIRNLLQLKTAVFLHWYLIRAVLLLALSDKRTIETIGAKTSRLGKMFTVLINSVP
jgi:hypothetical protein